MSGYATYQDLAAELDTYRGIYFHGISIQQRGSILPLAHGVNRRLSQNRVSANELHLFWCSVSGKNHVKNDGPLDVGRLRFVRILRVDFVDQLCQLYVSTYANAEGRSRTKCLRYLLV